MREAFESEQRTVSRLREMLNAEQERLFSLSQRVDGGQQHTGQVIDLDATRAKRKSGQSEGTENILLEQVREVLREHPGLSARAIAKKLSCSPTTAAKWKDLVERGQQPHGEASIECVNE